MANSTNERFRKRWGVSPDQKALMLRMQESGEISYRDAGGNGGVQQVHRLVDKGFLEHVPGIGKNPRWRLTDAGRDLMKRW